MDKTASRQEFIKVMHWLAEHPVEKKFLLNLNDPYSGEEYLRLMLMLEEDSLEYFIPLAYYNAFMNRDMEQAVNHIDADALEMMGERLGPEGFFHNFRKRLGEEIVRREQTEENDVLEGE
ncbi:hypothetical protein D1841_11405 [Neglecta sp. X4]|uniref:hypothetical protein n=1 Tax=unclassified Neglectibacter TaxID=2632164 RepID=UPI00136F9141|nr:MULTISPECIES: hypothetical protein [unclassified Neglectibacter]NBI18196.1 hypothetical protein [Neglectibacter sp. 59]NBJ73873.1 hypothetical protein [Neglectibacter sp. X4]NCE80601.1 hypothetical protein [Neglectibacter sp. X58]